MVELFKFRCYQCQKLIGAPPSRFGKVVKCPKCGVELIVPSPVDEPPADDEPDPDAVNLEDLGLRIDPEPISRPTLSPNPPPVPVGPDPVAFLNRLDQAEEAGDDPAVEAPEKSNEPSGDPEVAPLLPEPPVEPLIARGRGRAISRPDGPSGRSRDVVMPRTAAVAWALFALLGLAFAFLSGLLLGQRLGK